MPDSARVDTCIDHSSTLLDIRKLVRFYFTKGLAPPTQRTYKSGVHKNVLLSWRCGQPQRMSTTQICYGQYAAYVFFFISQIWRDESWWWLMTRNITCRSTLVQGTSWSTTQCIHSSFMLQSGTHPFQKGVNLFISKAGLSFCPLAELSLHPRYMYSSLMIDRRVLTRQSLVNAVPIGLEKAGIDWSKYTCSRYSFKIGTATTAADQGIENSITKTMGESNLPTTCENYLAPSSQLADYSNILVS